MDLIQSAQKRIGELLGEIEKLQSDLHRLQDFVVTAHELFLGISDASQSHRPSPESLNETKTFSTPPEIIAAAVNIIRELGKPVPRAEMFQELHARDIRVAGKEPKRNLSTILWRAPDIINIEGRGYWLAECDPPTG